MLASFTQVIAPGLGIAPGSIPWTQLLTAFERERALSLCEKGDIVPLVQHLALTELHMEHGSERRSLLHSGNRPGFSESLHSERQLLAQKWNVASRNVAEDVVVALYLDRRISWPRVQAMLRGTALSIDPAVAVAVATVGLAATVDQDDSLTRYNRTMAAIDQEPD